MVDKKTKSALGIASMYKEVFSTPAGEKVLQNLMKNFFVANPMVNARAENPTQLLEFREGQRSVVLSIMKTTGINLKNLQKRIDSNNETEDEGYEY